MAFFVHRVNLVQYVELSMLRALMLSSCGVVLVPHCHPRSDGEKAHSTATWWRSTKRSCELAGLPERKTNGSLLQWTKKGK